MLAIKQTIFTAHVGQLPIIAAALAVKEAAGRTKQVAVLVGQARFDGPKNVE